MEGYNVGLIEFERNVGMAYHSHPIEPQIRYLHIFCLYCLDFLFFDGDLDKGLFFNLGYLQANLYRGFTEINNLKSALPGGSPGIRLHFESYNKVLAIIQAAKEDEQKKQQAENSKKRATLDVTLDKEAITNEVTELSPARIECSAI